jgi:hypothetical protein
MSGLHAMPSLDELAANPKRATGLPKAALAALLRRNAVVQSVLVAELECTQDQPRSAPPPGADSTDQLLTATEAAQLLRRKVTWIYRNQSTLPFIRRSSPRSPILCLESEVRAYAASLPTR